MKDARLNVVLVNPYELGRQSFGIVHMAAQLSAEGHSVECFDLSWQRLQAQALAQADLIGLHLPMHTATRIAHEVLPRLRTLAPDAPCGLWLVCRAQWTSLRGGRQHAGQRRIEPEIGARRTACHRARDGRRPATTTLAK